MSDRLFYVILSTQRSGSTWFRRLLDSHPDIRAWGELFLMQPWEGWSDPELVPFSHHLRDRGGIRPFSTWSYLHRLRESPTSARALGFKLMYGQWAAHPELLPSLVRHRFRLIHLVRDNHLDMVISRERDERLGITHATDAVRAAPLHLEPGRLKRRLDRIALSVRLGRGVSRMWPHPVHVVHYEELVADPPTVLGGVLDFLEQRRDGVQLHTDLKRIASGSYRERIANYDEVAPLLRAWGYGHFLQDQDDDPRRPRDSSLRDG